MKITTQSLWLYASLSHLILTVNEFQHYAIGSFRSLFVYPETSPPLKYVSIGDLLTHFRWNSSMVICIRNKITYFEQLPRTSLHASSLLMLFHLKTHIICPHFIVSHYIDSKRFPNFNTCYSYRPDRDTNFVNDSIQSASTHDRSCLQSFHSTFHTHRLIIDAKDKSNQELVLELDAIFH